MITADSPATRIPVLLYHSVTDDPADSIAPYSVTPSAFARHMEAVAKEHHVLSISQLAGCLAGDAPLPRAPVVVTFDDGFADNLTVAGPQLAARSIPATVYVTTGYLGRAGMLELRSLIDLEALGIEIGAHAHSHTPMDELPLDRAREEIRRSKAVLEDALGHGLASFAYPHGYSTAAVREEVRAAGFGSACGVKNAFSHLADDVWCIARLTVRSETSVEQLERWLAGEGAPVAWSDETLQTRAWRAARRVKRVVAP